MKKKDILANKIQKMLTIAMRNHIILNYLNYPAKRRRINMHWFAISEKKLGIIEWKKTGRQNFGDYLANPIW